MADVGTPSLTSYTLEIAGIAGVNDNDVVIELDDASRYNEFTFMSTAGVMDVEVSLDGTNYVPATFTNQSVLAAAEQPHALLTVANQIFKLTLASIKSIRVSQNAAAAVANASMVCGSR